MRHPSCRDITAAIEESAPLSLQESYDNSGWQTGCPDAECTGVLVCVDITPERVAEAARLGCNLIVSHHPVLFHGLKQITGRTLVEQTVMTALQNGINTYSIHTALDNAPLPFGVSAEMARMLGLSDIRPLDCVSGGGAIGHFTPAREWHEALNDVKKTFSSPVVRTTVPGRAPSDTIRTVAMCSGAGSFMVDAAVEQGADMFICSDTSYHKFVDYADKILLVDIGHFESEQCVKEIVKRIIGARFPDTPIYKSTQETNPINYY